MDFCTDDGRELDYLNGLLSDEDRALFEEHLAGCPRCREEIVALRKTADAVAGLTSSYVPAPWPAAARVRLRAKKSAPVSVLSSSPAPSRRGTNVLLYALIAAGVTAGIVLLFWLVMGGIVHRGFPGFSAAALGIVKPRAVRMVDLTVWIVSLHTLLFVPSIIDNIYRLVRRNGRMNPPDRAEYVLVQND